MRRVLGLARATQLKIQHPLANGAGHSIENPAPAPAIIPREGDLVLTPEASKASFAVVLMRDVISSL